MKKFWITLLALALAALTLCGCSGGGKDGGGNAAQEPAQVTGETYDGGNLTVLVPEGWMAFNGVDFFDEYEEGYDPNVVRIAKNAESEWDLFSKPYIEVEYYGPDASMVEPYRDAYEDPEDLEPLSLGDYTWQGFTGKSLMEQPMAVLWTEKGEHQFQATLYLESGDSKISLEDAEVLAILESVAPAA